MEAEESPVVVQRVEVEELVAVIQETEVASLQEGTNTIQAEE